MRPSNICTTKMRSVVVCERKNPLKIENKEMLRDVVTDFIVRSLSSGAQSLSRRHKHIRYQPLPINIEINGRIQKLQFALPVLLQNYVEVARSSMQKDRQIQPMIVDILELIEKLEDSASSLSLEFQDCPSSEMVLRTLITKHIRDKKRVQLQGDYEEAKSKVYTKYKKVSFLSLGEGGLSRRHYDFFIDKTEQSSVCPSYSSASMDKNQQNYKPNIPTPALSKLKQLVDSCNIFQNSQKLQALKREKLISSFCSDQTEFQICRQSVKGVIGQSSVNNLDPGTMKMLDEWMTDISLSQYLFKRKYFPSKDEKDNKENLLKLSCLKLEDHEEDEEELQ